jgi:hypothetical protein
MLEDLQVEVSAGRSGNRQRGLHSAGCVQRSRWCMPRMAAAAAELMWAKCTGQRLLLGILAHDCLTLWSPPFLKACRGPSSSPPMTPRCRNAGVTGVRCVWAAVTRRRPPAPRRDTSLIDGCAGQARRRARWDEVQQVWTWNLCSFLIRSARRRQLHMGSTSMRRYYSLSASTRCMQSAKGGG